MANVAFDGTLNYLNPFALAANIEELNEIFTYSKMLKQDDRADFILAMQDEVKYHESNNHWKMIHRSSLPLNANTILGIWSFKRK